MSSIPKTDQHTIFFIFGITEIDQKQLIVYIYNYEINFKCIFFIPIDPGTDQERNLGDTYDTEIDYDCYFLDIKNLRVVCEFNFVFTGIQEINKKGTTMIFTKTDYPMISLSGNNYY
jgi:hypothetical protein